MDTHAIPAWRAELAPLRFLAAKVARVHGGSHPATAILAEVVAALDACPPDARQAQGVLAARLAELSDGFRPWPGSCASVYQLYTGLAAVTTAIQQGNPA